MVIVKCKRPKKLPNYKTWKAYSPLRGGICPCRQCRRQCKIFASGVNFSIFTHFLCFFLLKLLKLGEIDGVKFLAWKSGGVKFLTNSMSVYRSPPYPPPHNHCHTSSSSSTLSWGYFFRRHNTSALLSHFCSISKYDLPVGFNTWTSTCQGWSW